MQSTIEYEHYNPEHDHIASWYALPPIIPIKPAWHAWIMPTLDLTVSSLVWVFCIRIPFGYLLGSLVTALAIPFAESSLKVSTPYRDAPEKGRWHLRKLPKWAWLWSNDIDGTLGDYRGEWAEKRNWRPNTWLSQWLWLWRNPINNLRHVMLPLCGINAYTAEFEIIAGSFFIDKQHPGYQLLKITTESGYVTYRFKWFSKSGRSFEAGPKIEPWMLKFVYRQDLFERPYHLRFKPLPTEPEYQYHTRLQALHGNKGWTLGPA